MSRDTVQDEMILLVDIDEDTVEHFGGYPLPRDFYGELINYTAGTPGITIAFPFSPYNGAVSELLISSAVAWQTSAFLLEITTLAP